MYDIAVTGEQYMAQGIVVHNSALPNLQNIPVRTELGRRIRAAFVPEPGWRFVAADYSQIELRMLAHVSGEESLVEAFRRGEDIHRRTAAEVFGVPLDASDARAARRRQDHQLLRDLRGHRLRALPRARHLQTRGAGLSPPLLRAPPEGAGVPGRHRGGRARARASWQTLLGRRRYLPELRSGNPNLRGFAERMATNAPIQGTAADLIKIAMVRMARALEAGAPRPACCSRCTTSCSSRRRPTR